MSGTTKLVRKSVYLAKPYEELDDTHKMYAKLRAVGWTKRRAQKHLNISTAITKRCESTPEWCDLMRQETNDFTEKILDDARKNPRMAKVAEILPRAVKRMDEVLKSTKDENTVIKAADVVMKHSVGDSGKSAIAVAGVKIVVSDKKNSELEDLEKEICFFDPSPSIHQS